MANENQKKTVIVATGNREKMVEIRQIFASTGIELITMKDAGVKVEVDETGTTFEENALLKARAVAAASGRLTIADDSGLVVDAMGGEPGIHSARWMGHDTSYDIKNREIIRLVDEYCAGKEAGEGISPAAGGKAGEGISPAADGKTGEGISPSAGRKTGEDISPSAGGKTGTAGARHPGCGPDGVPGPLRSARFVCAVAAVWPDGKECTASGVLEGRIYTEQKGFNGFGYDPIFYLPEYGMTSGQIPREEKNRIGHRGQAFSRLGEILVRELSEETVL